MALSEDQVRKLGQNSGRGTLQEIKHFITQQIPDEEMAEQRYRSAAFHSLAAGKKDMADTFSAIADDESRHHNMLGIMETLLTREGVQYSPNPGDNGGGTAMALTAKEIREIATATADEVMDRVYGMTDMVAHVMEHEVLGGARVINPATAENPDIPCKCFSFEDEEYCWKPGYLGLISSKKNPEQLANCKIKVPASPGAQERFARIKGAVAKATEEHKEKGGGLPEYWTAVGEKFSEAGVTL